MRTNEAIWIEKSNRWQINLQIDGERRTFTSSTPGKKGKAEAERKADKWEEERTQNENIRFPKFWEEFLLYTKEHTSTSNHDQLGYIGRIHFNPVIKHKKVRDITNQDWQKCVDNAYKRGLSKKTCQNIRGAATSFYRYAKKCRVPMIQPEDIDIPKNAPKKEKSILQPDDIKKLFTVDTVLDCYKREQPAFYIHAWRFLLVTGLRRGELCGLKNADIENNILHVKRSVNRFDEVTSGKTEAANRFMVLPQQAIKILADQSKMLKEHGVISPYAFPNQNGNMTRPTLLYDYWRTYCNQHEIKCTLHEMRHTLISVAKSDVPPELLKQVVGHSKSMDTFGVYGHKVEGELERVANIFDNIFNTILK